MDLSKAFVNLTPTLPLTLISSIRSLERLLRVALYLGDKGSDSLDQSLHQSVQEMQA